MANRFLNIVITFNFPTVLANCQQHIQSPTTSLTTVILWLINQPHWPLVTRSLWEIVVKNSYSIHTYSVTEPLLILASSWMIAGLPFLLLKRSRSTIISLMNKEACRVLHKKTKMNSVNSIGGVRIENIVF
jgi:hypothetical protein